MPSPDRERAFAFRNIRTVSDTISFLNCYDYCSGTQKLTENTRLNSYPMLSGMQPYVAMFMPCLYGLVKFYVS